MEENQKDQSGSVQGLTVFEGAPIDTDKVATNKQKGAHSAGQCQCALFPREICRTLGGEKSGASC